MINNIEKVTKKTWHSVEEFFIYNNDVIWVLTRITTAQRIGIDKLLLIYYVSCFFDYYYYFGLKTSFCHRLSAFYLNIESFLNKKENKYSNWVFFFFFCWREKNVPQQCFYKLFCNEKKNWTLIKILLVYFLCLFI